MKIVSKVIGSMGFISMVVGASGMDSESLVIPALLILAGILFIVSCAIMEGLFWETEEIE